MNLLRIKVIFIISFFILPKTELISNDFYEGNSLTDTEDYFVIYKTRIIGISKRYSKINEIETKNFEKNKNGENTISDVVKYKPKNTVDKKNMNEKEKKDYQEEQEAKNNVQIYNDRNIKIKRRGEYGNESGYIYFKPKDGIYKLDSGIKFSVYQNSVVNIEKTFENEYKSDEFFIEKSKSCNAFKFNIIYDLFLNNKKYFFKSYQLMLNEYDFPDYIRIILFTENEGLDRENLDLNLFAKDLKIFYLSTKNEVGCLENGCYDYAEESEYVKYYMYMKKEPLIKKVACNGKNFFEVKNEKIIKIDKEKVTLFDKKN